MAAGILLAPVVQRLDNAIQRINHYPVDSAVCFVNIYPLDSVIQPLNNRGLGGKKHCESNLSCLKAQQDVPGRGSNPDHSIRYQHALKLWRPLGGMRFYFIFKLLKITWSIAQHCVLFSRIILTIMMHDEREVLESLNLLRNDIWSGLWDIQTVLTSFMMQIHSIDNGKFPK